METGQQYYDYLVEAERVRWRMSDLAWDEIDERAVDDDLVKLVVAAVGAELGTFGATQQFLHEFGGDVDFTQWVSIWFYEETKHPQALMRWLSRFGVTFTPDEVLTSRPTAPFVKSHMGTLAINIIAEMQAAESYIALAEGTREPVLRDLATRIAADEARHAGHFFGFASRALADTADVSDWSTPLSILWLWLRRGELIQHPGQITMTKLRDDEAVSVLDGTSPDERWARLQQRVCVAFGRLLDMPELRGPEDVPAAMRQMRREKAKLHDEPAVDVEDDELLV